jgi:PelA/Pel-15E family pectate lyase
VHKLIRHIQLVIVAGLTCYGSVYAQDVKKDAVAENMLVYQRNVGGWPKAVNEVPVNYNKTLTDEQRESVRSGANGIDATIDNNATFKEITYLVKAYKQTNNPVYLQSAEKGIKYLLKAQNKQGGWPQYFPDTRLYRAQITFNDNAMINTLNVLFDVAHGLNNFEVVDKALIPQADAAVQKGITCIIKTQIRRDGVPTGWCQQYDQNTLKPAMARKFELIGNSSSETVGIVSFLMRIDKPSEEVKTAVSKAMEWLNNVKIVGYKFEHVADASQANGKGARLVADATSTIWSRYYDIDTDKPFFSGRNSEKVYDVQQIENERRTGYAWYGTWPQKLIDKAYLQWAKKNGLAN